MSNSTALPSAYIPPPAGSITTAQLDTGTQTAIIEGAIPWQSGRWYGADATNLGDLSIAAAAVTANRHYAVPLFIPYVTSFSQLGVTVTTAVGTLATIGIYDAATALRTPGNLITTQGVAIATGNLVVNISYVTTGAAFVWLVTAFSGASTVQMLNPAIKSFGGTGAGDLGPIANGYVDRADITMPATFGAMGLFPTGAPLIRLKVT